MDNEEKKLVDDLMGFIHSLAGHYMKESALAKSIDNFTRRISEIKILEVQPVPYQLCPKCNGDGTLPQLHGTATSLICNVCNGAKIISQAVIK